MRTETVFYGGETAGPPEWLPAAFLGFVALLLYFGYLAGRRKRRFFEDISAFIPGEASGLGFLQNFSFRGTWRGKKLLIKYWPGGKNSPSHLEYVLEGPLFVFGLRVGKEDLVTSALGALGLARDLQTGDPQFDGRFRIKGEPGDLALRYLLLPGLSRRIAELFGEDGAELRIAPKGATIPGMISFRKLYPDLERELGMAELNRLLERLEALSAASLGAEFFGAAPGRGLAGGLNPGERGDHGR